MPQPEYVPLAPADRVRPTERLPVPDSWEADRPAEIKTVFQPTGHLHGNAGPDQGYGIKLAKQFKDRLQLAPGEHTEDAIAGCLAVALKRASIFGRAPVIYDFELAFTLWGFLGEAPAELVKLRQSMFEAAAYHYEDQRKIAEAVPESTLRLTPAQVREQLPQWRQLLTVD
jgi:hypothetical protein